MEPARIAALLQPFLAAGSFNSCHSAGTSVPGESAVLSRSQSLYISIYIDILLRWNARINLTAVRQPEAIVTRHFGESLFAARHLFPARVQRGTRETALPARCFDTGIGVSPAKAEHGATARVIDVGSGAGFPGLPLKIWAPRIRLTLIESNHKKATFLREVVRALTLTNVDVFAGRAENFPAQADIVTLRAVERLDAVLPIADRLVAPAGRLALLIGRTQVEQAIQLTPSLRWSRPIHIPLSSSRMLLIGCVV